MREIVFFKNYGFSIFEINYLKKNYEAAYIDICILDLLKNEKINRINKMIGLAQTNYIANAGTNSKKGFQHYKNFISRMESKIHMEENRIQQSTVWDKINKFENMRGKK